MLVNHKKKDAVKRQKHFMASDNLKQTPLLAPILGYFRVYSDVIRNIHEPI